MSSCSTENGGDLPTDVLYEIFKRLPLKPVFKFRCVSKLWNSLLCNPSLLHNVFSTTASPWAMVYSNNFFNSPQIFKTYSSNSHYNFINSHDGFSFQFLRGEKELCESCNYEEVANVYLLASSVNGLVLYTKRRCCDWTFNVCNPLTKQCVSLPPCPGKGLLDYNSFSLVSETSTTSDYKVVLAAYTSVSHTITLEIFSSDTGEWKTYKDAHSYDRTFTGLLSDMFIHDGVLYWSIYVYTDIYEYSDGKMVISAYNLENQQMPRNQLMLISLPEDIKDPNGGFFGMSEGSIYYGHYSGWNVPGFLSVWMLEEYCNGGWVWKPVHKNIEIKGHALFKDMFRVDHYFHPGDRNIVVFAYYSGVGSLCLAYDLGTQTYEVLCGSPIPSSLASVTSWPPFIITPKPTRIPSLSEIDN